MKWEQPRLLGGFTLHGHYIAIAGIDAEDLILPLPGIQRHRSPLLFLVKTQGDQPYLSLLVKFHFFEHRTFRFGKKCLNVLICIFNSLLYINHGGVTSWWVANVGIPFDRFFLVVGRKYLLGCYKQLFLIYSTCQCSRAA